MPFYKKKPAVVEARQLISNTAEAHAIYLWIEENTKGTFEPLAVIEGHLPCPASGVSIDPRDGRLMIATLEGLVYPNVGDYIIREITGEFYPCKPEIFEATYESW